MAQYLKARELAEVLHVTVKTIYRLEQEGEIPHSVKFGKSRRWDLQEVLTQINKSKGQDKVKADNEAGNNKAKTL